MKCHRCGKEIETLKIGLIATDNFKSIGHEPTDFELCDVCFRWHKGEVDKDKFAREVKESG